MKLSVLVAVLLLLGCADTPSAEEAWCRHHCKHVIGMSKWDGAATTRECRCYGEPRLPSTNMQDFAPPRGGTPHA
jgi:hypothetical protein